MSHKGGYVGDCIGDRLEVIKGDTRSLDYSSYGDYYGNKGEGSKTEGTGTKRKWNGETKPWMEGSKIGCGFPVVNQ